MAILRNKTQSQFTVISNDIFKDKRLSLKDRGLLCTLLSLPDSWDFSVSGLTKILKDGQTAIQSSLKSLENAGYLKRTKLQNEKGQFYDVLWEVFETAQEQTDNEVFPQSENPNTEVTHVENAHVENIQQSNTNKLNNKKLNNNQSNNNLILSYRDDLKEAIREDLEYITGYKTLTNSRYKDICDDIMEIMVEVCASNQVYYIINGGRVTKGEMEKKVRALDYGDIESIAHNIASQTHQIHNPKNYILKCIYDAKTTRNTININRYKANF